MSNTVKTLWAIRLYKRKVAGDETSDMIPFMENYYPTRKEMRVQWNTLSPIFKGELPGTFKAERYKVVCYDLIGKRSYSRVR